MSVTRIFLDTLIKLTSIKVKEKVIQNPIRSNNSSKTISNVNDVFKYINIWDSQIDEMSKGTGYPFNCEGSIFIELILGEAQQLLNNVKSYPKAEIVFHIFHFQLNNPIDPDKMEMNTKIYDYRDIVVSNISGWSPPNCSSFMSFKDILDYKHGNISKYLLGYNFNFIDYTGSIYDNNSPNYLPTKKLINPTISSISIFKCWKSNIQYTQFISAIINGYTSITESLKIPNVYLCKISNSDIEFNVNNWILIPSWKSKNIYLVDDYIYILNNIYICVEENNDIIFIPSKWSLVANNNS